MAASPYIIKLPQFEGPFDLLLFFIERDELDIYDIPIAKITADYLGYIRQIESLNVEVASEFILVAATLMRIKAKMLLPRKPLNEAGEEIDPRQELVERLLEYKRFKSILEEMRLKEESRSVKIHRGNSHKELKKIAEIALIESEWESITLYKLMRTFARVMERAEDRDKQADAHRIYHYPVTIKDQQNYILSKLIRRDGSRANFTDIFSECESRMHAVITFLAMLELLTMQQVSLTQGEGMNNFWLALSDR